MRINLSEYEGQPFPDDPQKQIIYRLIMQLRYYIKAPINELNTALPELEALEQQCKDFDEINGKDKINYIMEIVAALHEEQKNERISYHGEDSENLFWETVMVLKEKILKARLLKKVTGGLTYRITNLFFSTNQAE